MTCFHIATDHLTTPHFAFPDLHWSRLVEAGIAPSAFDGDIMLDEIVDWLRDHQIDWTMKSFATNRRSLFWRKFCAVIPDNAQAALFRLAFPLAEMIEEPT